MPRSHQNRRRPVARAAALLRAGAIVALRGLGGFHLCCDASSEAAVATLRARKRREEKPLAVMVASLDAARPLAIATPEEEALLAGVERPIVLCRRRDGAGLASGVYTCTLAAGSARVSRRMVLAR